MYKNKPPLSYYGGKTNLLPFILPMIPEHEIYIEPFLGGGAVYYAKNMADTNVLNDSSQVLMDFYRASKSQFNALYDMIQETLHSEADHKRAKVIYLNPEGYSLVERAWAVWVRCNMSFARSMLKGFAFDKDISRKLIHNKKRFFNLYQSRLERATIFSRPAIELPESYNTAQAFTYADPPYLGSNNDHYGHWTEENEADLMEWLGARKGSFLLSGYDNPIRQDAIDEYGWKQIQVEQNIRASKAKAGARKDMKTETLTYNYTLPGITLSMF